MLRRKKKLLVLTLAVALSLVACASDDDDDSGTDIPGTTTNTGNTVDAPAGDEFRGGLVWDNWTKKDAGGADAMPDGAVNSDFLRCKSCHGWDAAGKNGGYVRRSAKDTRPNPTDGIDLTSKTATVATVGNASGRIWSVEDQTMPNFTASGGLSEQQLADVVAFINKGPKVGDIATLDTSKNPVAYVFTDANISEGLSLYTASCAGCHDADGSMSMGDYGTLGKYVSADGKYSELFQKIVYGIPGKSMTRASMKDLTANQARDILAYIQSEVSKPEGVFYVGDAFRGGLVWDNWTKMDAGGADAMPDGAVNSDFLRCKSCHGWDAAGKNGGYIRRSAKDTRPNPTDGIDLTSKTATVATVGNASGRIWSVEDQTMPNFTATGGLSLEQIKNVVAFINEGPKVGDIATLDTSKNPVAYVFTEANISEGLSLYTASCAGCHGADGSMSMGDYGTLGKYVSADGKYSELFQKIVYGIPGKSMTRASMKDLTANQARDILAYIQSENTATGTFSP